MNSVAGSSVPFSDRTSRAAMPEISLFRLYTLRAFYLVVAAGLGVYIWPVVLHHTNELAAAQGIRLALLGGLGAIAAFQLRVCKYKP